MTRDGEGTLSKLLLLLRLLHDAIIGRRFRRALAAAPSFSLATLPEDTRGKITGIARPLAPLLEAPLTGRPCVHYHLRIEQLRAGVARELASEQDAVQFILEDRDHRAVIDPVHARISAGFDHWSKSRAAFDADPVQRSLLERHALVYRDWFWTDSVRYREAIIEVDKPIAVVGIATREPDLEATSVGLYRDPGATRLWLRGSPRFPLVISDDPSAL